MIKRSLVVILLVAASCALLAAQAQIVPRTAEQGFAAGGKVWMDLAAGDYRIRAGRDDRVFVQLTTPDPDDIASCKPMIEKKGRDLLIVTKGPRGGMHGTIELPSLTDLNVRVSAGDMTVEGIRGSKDISSWAGDVSIEVGPRDAYKKVHASVTAGELRAGPFDVRKGGLFRSFSWQGPGTYILDARLTAGDLTLR